MIMSLRLCDFVFVMGEFKIESATMNIDQRLMEDGVDHDDAFCMPARSSRSDFGIELDAIIIGELPKGEVERILFLVGDIDSASGYKIIDLLFG